MSGLVFDLTQGVTKEIENHINTFNCLDCGERLIWNQTDSRTLAYCKCGTNYELEVWRFPNGDGMFAARPYRNGEPFMERAKE